MEKQSTISQLGLFDIDTDHVRGQFRSWLSLFDPSTGPFSISLDGENRTLYTLGIEMSHFRFHNTMILQMTTVQSFLPEFIRK